MIKWIISSSCLILIVTVIRKLFQGKISLRLQYALWILVAIRLLVPVNLGSSVLSIENFTNQLTIQQQKEDITVNSVVHESFNNSTDRIKVFDSIEEMNANENAGVLLEEYQPVLKENAVSLKPADKLEVSDIIFGLWGIGASVVVTIFFISNIVFGKRVKKTRILLESQKEKLLVYQSSIVETPCLFGIIRPGIYVTNAVAADENILRHAVTHELTHYKHGDLWWSLLRCLCLTLHWYNPLVWWAAKLSKQDAELACDEATIQKLGEEERLAYGKTLIRLTCEKRQDLFVAATTMTSDKKSITERIQRIAKKRKLTIYALVGVLVVSGIAVGCTFTGAEDSKDTETNESAVVRGVPCENPEAEGWNLSHAKDVRENFSRMSPEPEEGTTDEVYLLGETANHGYFLYGKGDYQTMLVEMAGKYAEIDFLYASNYMELPRLIEKDIDRDGKIELCIIVWLQHGTGLHIENLLLADFNEEGQLYVYEFVQENYTEQLQEAFSYEITEEGIQPFIDGQPAGRMSKHLEDMGAYTGASVGNQVRFDCDPLTGEVRLRGDIMLLIEEHPGALWNHANDVSAKVCWDGEKFTLSNFTSNNIESNEKIDYQLNSEKIIEKANTNLREGYLDAKLTYVDNEEVGWNFYSDNPWSTEEERDALAQAALKELYTLTGYNVTECTYTTDGRSRFIFGKSAEYIKKCIAFYSRDYGFTLCGDSVPYQGFMNARKFHYSDVQQLASPLDGGVEEYEGGFSIWGLEHSGVYQGEKIIGHEEINKDDTVYTHVKLMFDGGYYVVVIDKSISSCHEVMGPYYDATEEEKIELVEAEADFYKDPQKDKVCFAVMPDGISQAGGDYRYIIPENQEEWVKAYKEMCELAAGNGRWQENERSMGIWIVYNDEWTCLTDQGFIVNFDYRTKTSDAQGFYELCLNEVKKHGINEPVRPEEIKNLESATLGYDGMYLLTDERSLFELQKAFSSSWEVRGGAGCPFTALLSLKFENGETKTIYFATDSCDTWLSSGVYYQCPGFEDIEELQNYFSEHGTDISSALSIFEQ